MVKPVKAPETPVSQASPSLRIDRAGLVDIYESLAAIKGSLDEVMHRWRAAAMRQHLKSLVEPIIEQRNDAAEQRPKEYDEERDALCRKYALKDKDGAPRIVGQNYLINPDQQAEFDTESSKLKDKHKKALDTFEKLVKDTNKFLEEEIDVPLPPGRLKLSWFNKNTNQAHLESLFPLIDCDIDEATIDASKAPKADK